MRDYQTKSNAGGVADSINAERFGAGEFNSIAEELENAVTSAGLTLAPADGTGEVSTQLSESMGIYGAGGAQYMLDTGVAHAYILNPVSPIQPPTTYFDGMTISFKPGNINTGASTVNVASIGAKNITTPDGSSLSAGIISNTVTIRYSSSNDRFEIVGDSIGVVTISVIETSTTYNPPSGVKALEFIAIGAGGGAGGVDGQGATTAAVTGGGGGGGTAIKLTHIIESSYTIVIGSGGSAGAAGNNNGSAGGNTTVSSTNVNLTASGGSGSTGLTGSATILSSQGAAGGSATGGDLNMVGGRGSTGSSLGIPLNLGDSGNSILGGKQAGNFNGNGASATLYGGGGGGTGNYNTVTDYAGGDGFDGVLIIKEYF